MWLLKGLTIQSQMHTYTMNVKIQLKHELTVWKINNNEKEA